MTEHPNILLVEDNEDDVILIQRSLRKAGITAPIHVVRDGEKAIDYLEEASQPSRQSECLPAVVLLDLKLPRRSGLEVLAWIRAHSRLAMLPVVVFTTSAQDSDVREAYALGANSYLKKPVGIHETTEVLKSAGLYWLTHNIRPPATLQDLP